MEIPSAFGMKASFRTPVKSGKWTTYHSVLVFGAGHNVQCCPTHPGMHAGIINNMLRSHSGFYLKDITVSFVPSVGTTQGGCLYVGSMPAETPYPSQTDDQNALISMGCDVAPSWMPFVYKIPGIKENKRYPVVPNDKFDLPPNIYFVDQTTGLTLEQVGQYFISWTIRFVDGCYNGEYKLPVNIVYTLGTTGVKSNVNISAVMGVVSYVAGDEFIDMGEFVSVPYCETSVGKLSFVHNGTAESLYDDFSAGDVPIRVIGMSLN